MRAERDDRAVREVEARDGVWGDTGPRDRLQSAIVARMNTALRTIGAADGELSAAERAWRAPPSQLGGASFEEVRGTLLR